MAERAGQHGGSHTFDRYSAVMQALFPEGITIENPEEWDVFGTLQMIVHKLCRLANGIEGDWYFNPENPHDLGNYAFILEAQMRNVIGEPVEDKGNPLEELFDGLVNGFGEEVTQSQDLGCRGMWHDTGKPARDICPICSGTWKR